MLDSVVMVAPKRLLSAKRFGVYEVTLRSGELRKAGKLIRVQSQPMRVLQILLEHPGEVVTREELCNQLWPGESFGDFDQAVNAAIAKLRSVLGDSADNPRFIETLPKLGYRFLPEVVLEYAEPAVDSETPSEPKQSDPEQSYTELPRQPASVSSAALAGRVRRPAIWIALAVVLLIGVAGLAFWQYQLKHGSMSKIRSLAVLPLENLSGDASQDYFADGMTDELITDLAQIRTLRVISRTSTLKYKNTRKSLPEIARDLNVDAVVEGSAVRSGDRVRITAQLIRASTDQHLWAESYEGDMSDSLALQKKVARAIAEQIRIELTPQEEGVLESARTVDPAAYEDYLRGRYFWNQRTADGLERAVEYFNQAIAKDPNYAQAYSGLADTYALLGDWQYATMTTREALPKAKAAATKALQIDNTLSEAHTSLAFTLDGFDWDLKGAGREFEQAIVLNPGYATAHHWYAWHLALLARYDEAMVEMRKAQNLDPLSLIINADLAELLLIAHRNEESIQQSQRTIEMDPDFAMAHNQLAQAYLAKHMPDKAIPELKKAIDLSGGSPTSEANLARAYVAVGDRNKAVELIGELQESSRPGFSHAAEIATIYAALGKKDQAMNWLEKGAEEKFNPGVLIRPGFDPMRSDPRFQALLRRIGLPQ
ncbi:winged helix-turn-helix domain-containing protein [Acidicapsa ligni]|uniref:winged helix-turn-helix domain-containing protein n=1 Tax=Acidicapsa ligni TaxID=542300 RepID=UPI0021E0EF2A|nr:winged helix-turn-helix domain-containing protein [Acidicapsa ligni]